MEYIKLNQIERCGTPRNEAETTINIGYSNNSIKIYTSDNSMLTKIIKAASKNPEGWKCWCGGKDRDGNIHGYFFEAPKNAVRLASGSRKKKEVTEEMREAFRNRCKEAREKKVKNN